MRRVVNLWLALLAAYWLTRAGASSLLFGRVAQGYPALVELLAIPALQAVAIAWATRQPDWSPLALAVPWRQGWRLTPLRGALAVDAIVIAAAWLTPAAYRPAWLAPSLDAGLPAWLAALKLAAAAALLAAALCRPRWSARDRLAVAAVATALLALAAEPWQGWLAALPGRLGMVTPPAMRWFGGYGALLAAALVLVLQAAAALRRHSGAAALAFEWALALLLAAGGCAALGFAGRAAAATAAPASWTPAAATLGSLSATALLVGAALAAAAADTAAPAPAGAPGGEAVEQPA